MARLVDRVVETTQTTGTGTLDLLGASTGYRSFSDGLASGDQVFYAIDDDPSAPTVWEYGIGTWTSGSPSQLSRDEVLGSSNGGAKISLQAGTTYTVTGILAVRAMQDGAWKWLTGAAGTNTITANASPALGSYKAGQEFNFVAVGANTGAATLDIDSLGPKAIKKAGASGLSALSAGDIQAGHVVKVVYDGTQFVMASPVPVPANIAVTDADNDFSVSQTVTNATSAAWLVSAGTVTARLIVDSTGAFVGGTSAHSTFLQAQGATVATLLNGMTIGAPTGGDKGAGTLNVPAYYKNGTAISGIVEGTALTLNPYAVSSTASQAHGLGAKPRGVNVVLECLTAELGYTVGDQVPMPEVGFFVSSSGGVAYSFIMDATSLVIRTNTSLLPTIMNKSTNATGTITAANWKMIATPYKVV